MHPTPKKLKNRITEVSSSLENQLNSYMDQKGAEIVSGSPLNIQEYL